MIRGEIFWTYTRPLIIEAQRQVDEGYINSELFEELKYRGVTNEVKGLTELTSGGN